jgi:hypothetical protein
MNLTLFNVFTLTALSDYLFSLCCHSYPFTPYFFLLAMVFAGPLRVLALVLVR